MNKEQSYTQSQLFTVRIWREDLSAMHSEWRGKLKHVSSGEVEYFKSWEEMIDLMLRMLSVQENSGQRVQATG